MLQKKKFFSTLQLVFLLFLKFFGEFKLIVSVCCINPKIELNIELYGDEQEKKRLKTDEDLQNFLKSNVIVYVKDIPFMKPNETEITNPKEDIVIIF